MEFVINAKKRDRKGTSSSRNIRKEGIVPGIIYGAGAKEQTISLNKHEIAKSLENDAFYSQVFDISLDGKKQQVILRDIQRHPAKREILHMDFQRIKADQKINVTIPFNFINEDIAPGVKIDGGLISHLMTEIEVICLPADIPENITVDLAELPLDHPIHVTELILPKGIELTLLQHGAEDADKAVVVIHKAKAIIEEEEETEAPEASEVASDQKHDENKEADEDAEKEPSGKEPSGKEPSGKESSGKESSGKEPGGKESSEKEPKK